MALSNLKIGTRLYLAFGAVIALLAILVASAQANFSRLGEANGLNIHTYEVMGEANALLESLINIETGERGFALTGKDSSLEPLASGQRGFTEHLQKIRALTADNPAQLERLKALEGAQQQWLATAICAEAVAMVSVPPRTSPTMPTSAVFMSRRAAIS